jgi:hypothetical protein
MEYDSVVFGNVQFKNQTCIVSGIVLFPDVVLFVHVLDLTKCYFDIFHIS